MKNIDPFIFDDIRVLLFQMRGRIRSIASRRQLSHNDIEELKGIAAAIRRLENYQNELWLLNVERKNNAE